MNSPKPPTTCYGGGSKLGLRLGAEAEAALTRFMETAAAAPRPSDSDDQRGGDVAEPSSLPSTRARPRRAPSCSMTRCSRSASRSSSSRRSFPRPAGSSTIRRASGPPSVATARAAMASAGAGSAATSPRSASPISARPRSSGTARPASRSTTRSSGRTAARTRPARRCARAGHEKHRQRAHRAAARSVFLGDENRLAARQRARARARPPKPASSPSARSTRFLLWRLTGGKVHATDATNAARTLLLDIRTGQWDEELLRPVRHPGVAAARGARLRRPISARRCRICSAAPVRILGIAGDQQAATVGQGCFTPGMMKSTYGTGCFALLNTGDTPVHSRDRLLTTIAYQLERQAHLRARRRDLHRRRGGAMAARRAEADRDRAPRPARSPPPPIRPSRSIWCRPSSASARRGGMRRRAARSTGSRRKSGAGRDQPRRARSGRLPDPRSARRDARRLAGAPSADTVLRVDGGMTASDYTMQFLADILDAPVDRPVFMETTALGAAYLAGLQGRRLSRPRRLRRDLAARPPLRAADGRGNPRAQMERLAGCGAPHVDAALGLTISDRRAAELTTIFDIGFTRSHANLL